MIELLNSIVNFIISIIGFILQAFKALILFFTSIPQYVNFITYTIGGLPDFLIPFAAFSVTFTIFLMILPKDTK